MRKPATTITLRSPGAAQQFRLDFADEIFLDEFAGGGGASTGYWMATGRHVDAAVNHNPEACSMHFINHPQTLHFCQSVWEVDPMELLGRFMGRKIGGAWFSPDCKHFSKAKGGALVDKRIRGLAWILLKWVGRAGGRLSKGGRGPACPRTIFLENVEEFQTWGPLIAKRCPKTGRVVKTDGTVAAPGEVVPYRSQHLVPDSKRKGLYFQRLKATLVARGATAIECRELRACDYGVPTIRKRLFMVVRFDGRPIVWPAPTHGTPTSPEVQAGDRLPYRAVAECLDFSIPCPSIFLSKGDARAIGAKRPLESATLARVAKGVDRYVLKSERPFIVNLTHHGIDGVESIDVPVKTVTAANRGEKALVAPVIAHAQHGGKVRSAESPLHTVAASTKDQNQVIMPVLVGCGGRAGQSRPRTAAEPLATSTSKADTCLAAVHLTKFNTGSVGSSADAPAPTITANSFIKRPGGAPPMGVVSAFVARQFGTAIGHAAHEPSRTVMSDGGGKSQLVATFLAQHNTGVVGHTAEEPASTISAKGSQQAVVGASLIKYYGTDQDPRMEDPSHSVTTKDRFGLVEWQGNLPVLSPELAASARVVAKFLRDHGVEFDGEFATVGEHIIVDIGMRMLTPRELYRAQGFPEQYIIDRGMVEDPASGQLREVKLTKTAQVRMVGNSVCPPMAAVIIAANLPEMRIQEQAA